MRNRPDPPAVDCNQRRLWRTPGRERLSNTCTLAFVSVRSRCARFDPMNPAPPKMTAERKAGFPLVFLMRFLSGGKTELRQLRDRSFRAVLRGLRPDPFD